MLFFDPTLTYLNFYPIGVHGFVCLDVPPTSPIPMVIFVVCVVGSLLSIRKRFIYLTDLGIWGRTSCRVEKPGANWKTCAPPDVWIGRLARTIMSQWISNPRNSIFHYCRMMWVSCRWVRKSSARYRSHCEISWWKGRGLLLPAIRKRENWVFVVWN